MVACPGFEPAMFWSVRSQVPPRATFHTTWRPKLRSEHCGPRHRQSAALLCYDVDRLSSRSFDANGIAAVSRSWRLAPRYCTRSASTALQYRIEKNLTKANYMKVARTVSTS